MPEFLQGLFDVLDKILMAIITIAIPYLVPYLVKFFKTKIDEEKNNGSLIFANTLIQMACDIVLQAVENTSQTYVDSIKNGGSVLNSSQQKEAFNKSKELALKMLSEGMKEVITTAYGDFDVWLNSKIEQTVRLTKTTAVIPITDGE